MKTIFTFFGFLLFFCADAQSVHKTGTLDNSFGVDGKVVTDFDSGTSVSIIKGLIQPDNKIIAVGQYESTSPPYYGFFVIRYMPDGSIDSSFAHKGKTIIIVPSIGVMYPHAACLQNDGKILIAGHGIYGLFPMIASGVIVRLNTDGKLDSSFGTNGSIITRVDNSGSYSALAVQADKKIVAVGYAGNSHLIDRFLENGQLDISFGTNGFVSLENRYVGFSACKIQQDGKIVIGGGYGNVPEQFFLKRFKTNGILDSSFGSNGTTVTKVGDYDSYITDLAFQLDGKIVALGSTDNYTSSANARYNVDGSLDTTFANNGIAHNFFPGIYGGAVSLLIQDDNKILLGGGIYIEKSFYALERLTANGFIDSSFGFDGGVTTDFSNYDGSGIASIGLQTSEKIIAIGGSVKSYYYNVSLARYNNDLSKKQIIISKIKHYISTHNNAQVTTLNTVSIYPNPAQNILHVTGLSTNSKLTVIDFTGNIKLQAITNNNSCTLNISSLQAGNYLLKIETKNDVVTKQFVKEE